MKKILILGPLWRNKGIIKNLKKEYNVYITNKKIYKNYIKQKKIDFLITSGYPFLVKENVLKIVKKKINLHISYLPFGRGIMPNLWCFYEGYPPGITIHALNKNFDAGKIIIQKKVSFKNLKKETLKSTHDYLLGQLENFFLSHYKKIFDNKIKGYRQDKFIKVNRYHSRKESEKLISKFKKKWNTKIKDVIKYGKKTTLPK